MNGIGQYSKAIAAALMAILIIADQAFGISFTDLTEEWLTSALAVISAVLVYFVPNKGAGEEHADS